MLFGGHPGLERVAIRLEKPEALRGRARSASVRIERSRGEFPTELQAHACGSRELLLHTHEARLELFRIHPFTSAELGPGSGAKRIEWKVAGQLTLEGRPLERGPVAIPGGQPSCYRNDGGDIATVFRCECSLHPIPAAPA
jgi:hypothetical protein